MIAIGMIGLVSCGETNTTTTEAENEYTPQMEAAAQLNFDLGIADYNLYVKFMKIHVSEMEYTTEDTGTLKTANKSRDVAKEKFEFVLSDHGPSVYADSAQIYLDSMDWYSNYFNDELKKIYDK